MPLIRTNEELLPLLHPGQQDLLGFFEVGHLPPHLQEIVEPFRNLAWETAHRGFGGPHGAQTTKAIDNLLLAKDAAVRAGVPKKQ